MSMATLPISLPFIAVVTLCLLILYWYRRPKGSPPGPRGIPFLGVIPFTGSSPERKFKSWSKKYGPVMSVRMGRTDWVVLNDFESINQAFVKNGHIFSGRPKIPVLEVFTNGHGIAMLDYGRTWKDQRKFGVIGLRGFGLRKWATEDRIIEEAGYLIETIKRQQGKAFFLETLMAHTVANVIFSIAFGRRFEYGDRWLGDLLHSLHEWDNNPRITACTAILTFVPWLGNIPPFFGVLKNLKADVNSCLDKFEVLVDEHEKSLDPENLRNFIDAFLVEMKKGTETFTKIQLLQYMRDLFEAGTETTSSTLRWGLLCLLHYPQTQEKLYKEIIGVLGEEGRPKFSMRGEMPYCNAFIHEVERFRTLVPVSLPHCTSEDAEIYGYKIRKGTAVLPNIWAVHNDPNLFDQPDKFDPDRHIDEKGNFVKSNHVIPFSLGPRVCLGEQIANMELFLFITSMVQRFRFEPKPGEMPKLDSGSPGTAFVPYDYELIATERKL